MNQDGIKVRSITSAICFHVLFDLKYSARISKSFLVFLVVEDAEPHRQSLMNCVSSRDCRMAIERLRKIFLNHPVSAKYYDDSDEKDNQSNSASSIFKWG